MLYAGTSRLQTDGKEKTAGIDKARQSITLWGAWWLYEGLRSVKKVGGGGGGILDWIWTGPSNSKSLRGYHQLPVIPGTLPPHMA